jgi:SOS-response transcriptional repressor LexA
MSTTYCEDKAGNLYELNEDGGLVLLKRQARVNGTMNDTAQGVYEFILRYKQAHDGIAPTLREIGVACGISSTSVVVYNLDKLEAVGKIRLSGRNRAIEVVGGRWIAPKEVGA